jgi:hypothetical protein
VCTAIGALGVAALVVLGVAVLVARWQYYGPERRTNPATFNVIAASAVAAGAALVILWLGHC